MELLEGLSQVCGHSLKGDKGGSPVFVGCQQLVQDLLVLLIDRQQPKVGVLQVDRVRRIGRLLSRLKLAHSLFEIAQLSGSACTTSRRMFAQVSLDRPDLDQPDVRPSAALLAAPNKVASVQTVANGLLCAAELFGCLGNRTKPFLGTSRHEGYGAPFCDGLPTCRRLDRLIDGIYAKLGHMATSIATGGDTSGVQRSRASRRPRSEQRQRTALVALRLLPEEREMLVQAAEARGVSLSELLRVSAMDAVRRLAG